jgi:hypothetical protein
VDTLSDAHIDILSDGEQGRLRRSGRLGGGMVESYPEDTAGRKVAGSFLYNATVALFERHGFERVRQVGKHHWVVSRFVGAASVV